MATKVTVELPDKVYQRVRRYARLHQQDMEKLLSGVIEEGLDAKEAEAEIVDWTEPDPAVDREMEAYIAMHPALKEKYFGKYVAVYHGELIDYDDDPGALF
jgi:hypothetical protein